MAFVDKGISDNHISLVYFQKCQNFDFSDIYFDYHTTSAFSSSYVVSIIESIVHELSRNLELSVRCNWD